MTQSHEIWIVRHSETEWTRSGQHTGRTDLPLTGEGVRAAQSLAQRLGGRRFALVLTSPLRRAADTASLAGYGDVAQRCDDLMEWDYGRYEGRTTADIRKERPGWSLWNDGVPGGETIDEVAARARRVIAIAQQAGGDVALFAHGHVSRVLVACWLELAPQLGRLFELAPGGVGVLSQHDGGPVLRRWNLV
jgi:broad specificity phosphatase PhoE